MPLTDAKIRNAKPSAKPSAKPIKLTDGHGLYLEVRPTGEPSSGATATESRAKRTFLQLASISTTSAPGTFLLIMRGTFGMRRGPWSSKASIPRTIGRNTDRPPRSSPGGMLVHGGFIG